MNKLVVGSLNFFDMLWMSTALTAYLRLLDLGRVIRSDPRVASLRLGTQLPFHGRDLNRTLPLQNLFQFFM